MEVEKLSEEMESLKMRKERIEQLLKKELFEDKNHTG